MVIKYRIYAEDDNENQISKSYVVRNPNSFLTRLLVLYIKICCLTIMDVVVLFMSNLYGAMNRREMNEVYDIVQKV